MTPMLLMLLPYPATPVPSWPYMHMLLMLLPCTALSAPLMTPMLNMLRPCTATPAPSWHPCSFQTSYAPCAPFISCPLAAPSLSPPHYFSKLLSLGKYTESPPIKQSQRVYGKITSTSELMHALSINTFSLCNFYITSTNKLSIFIQVIQTLLTTESESFKFTIVLHTHTHATWNVTFIIYGSH